MSSAWISKNPNWLERISTKVGADFKNANRVLKCSHLCFICKIFTVLQNILQDKITYSLCVFLQLCFYFVFVKCTLERRWRKLLLWLRFQFKSYIKVLEVIVMSLEEVLSVKKIVYTNTMQWTTLLISWCLGNVSNVKQRLSK